MVWVSIPLAQHIDFLSGGNRIQRTHTHSFLFPFNLFCISHSHSHFLLPSQSFPSPSPYSSPFSACLFLLFHLASSMELKHKSSAMVKFTLKRNPPPSRPWPLCRHPIPVTLLCFHRNEGPQQTTFAGSCAADSIAVISNLHLVNVTKSD